MIPIQYYSTIKMPVQNELRGHFYLLPPKNY